MKKRKEKSQKRNRSYKKKSQMLDKLNSRVEMTKDRISELEDRSKALTQSEQKENKLGEKRKSLNGKIFCEKFCGTKTNKSLGSQKEKANGIEKLHEEIMAEIPKLGKRQ